MAPGVASEIDAIRRSGQLVIHRGWPNSIQRAGRGLVVEIGGAKPFLISAGMVVNCAGLERCVVSASPFLSDLVRKDLIRPDPLGLGIAVDANSMASSEIDTMTRGLFAIGPLTAGRHWEITAVPDIRVQARSVAERMADQIRFFDHPDCQLT